MINITNAHNFHMELSYDTNHVIYKHLEKSLSKKNILFNRHYTISMNIFGRYDLSLFLLKGYIFADKEKFLQLLKNVKRKFIINQIKKNIHNCITNDMSVMSKCLPSDVNTAVNNLCELYELKLKLFNDDCDLVSFAFWIYQLYDDLKNWYIKCDSRDSNFNNSKLIAKLYFLGTLEWFHLMIIQMLLNETANCIMILGENNNIEIENLTNMSSYELKIYIASEYNSHSVLYIKTNNFISMYDPDHCNESDDNIHMLCNLLNTRYQSIQINNTVQSITDDQYCIFHCIWFMSMIAKYKVTKLNLKKIMDYHNKLNNTTLKSTVLYLINDMLLKIEFNLFALL
jgi:hypothetical protein